MIKIIKKQYQNLNIYAYYEEFNNIFNNISTILNESFETNKKFQDLHLKLIYFPKNLFS